MTEGDSLDLLMKVVARAFKEPNQPQFFSIGAFNYLTKKVLKAKKFFNFTPADVSGIVKKLEDVGINADYVRSE